jgi:hypothetical protein
MADAVFAYSRAIDAISRGWLRGVSYALTDIGDLSSRLSESVLHAGQLLITSGTVFKGSERDPFL